MSASEAQVARAASRWLFQQPQCHIGYECPVDHFEGLLHSRDDEGAAGLPQMAMAAETRRSAIRRGNRDGIAGDVHQSRRSVSLGVLIAHVELKRLPEVVDVHRRGRRRESARVGRRTWAGRGGSCLWRMSEGRQILARRSAACLCCLGEPLIWVGDRRHDAGQDDGMWRSPALSRIGRGSWGACLAVGRHGRRVRQTPLLVVRRHFLFSSAEHHARNGDCHHSDYRKPGSIHPSRPPSAARNPATSGGMHHA